MSVIMGARPPQSFVEHVVEMSEAFEDAGRDESWWRSQQGDQKPGGVGPGPVTR
jgi:hypothetical protein